MAHSCRPHASRPRCCAGPDLSAELLEVLICHSEDLHTVVDLDARLLFVNQAALRVYGHSPSECLGRSALDFTHPDDRDATQRAFDAWVIAEPDEPLHFENRQVSRTGVVNYMAWTIYPQYADDSTLLGFASTARDITAQRLGTRRALRTSKLTRTLLDGMLDPVIAIDDHGTIRVASRSVRDVFGYEPDELVGNSLATLLPEPSLSACRKALQTYRATGQSEHLGRTVELQILHQGGYPIDVELSVSEVEAPESRHLFIGSFRDITRRRQAERAERSMLRALATIGESAALLAHEIKHPVTAVNLALRAVADKLGEDEQEVIGDLAARMRRLELQLRQTLSFARPLDLARTPCPPGELLGRVAHAMGPILERARISLTREVAPGTPPVPADAGRLEEVLTNLVMNAVEMLDPGGRVRMRAALEGTDHVHIDIEDDGPGVPADLAESLFRPFVTSKPEGTGLGLPICRRIVEEHGGTIALLDAEDVEAPLGGATLRIVLPLSPAKEPTS
jgi:two-component system sensor kinase FixL